MLSPLFLLVLCFSLEMVDNGLGGGFGTILSPLLVILGYDPRVVVPSILLSETVSGLWGGGWHRKFKNVNLRAVAYTLLGSLVGMVSATYLIGAVLPVTVTKQFIGIISLLMGVFVVVRSFNFSKQATGNDGKFSPKYVLLGSIIGFNKGGTGGGYGPLSVSGYMALGFSAATAIGTTTIAEGIASLLGVVLYTNLTGIVLEVALPMTLGAFLADPLSAYVNNYLKKKLEPPFHGRIIGLVMCVLGILTTLKNFKFL